METPSESEWYARAYEQERKMKDIRYLRNYPEELEIILEDNDGKRTKEFDVISLNWLNTYGGVKKTSHGDLTKTTKNKLNRLYEKIFHTIYGKDSSKEMDYPFIYEKEESNVKKEKSKEKREEKKELETKKRDFETFREFSKSRTGFIPPRPIRPKVYTSFPSVQYAKSEFPTKKTKLENIYYGKINKITRKELENRLVEAIQLNSVPLFENILSDLQKRPLDTTIGFKKLISNMESLLKGLKRNDLKHYLTEVATYYQKSKGVEFPRKHKKDIIGDIEVIQSPEEELEDFGNIEDIKL